MSGEKVFVSSTWIDNVERRQLVEQAIVGVKMIPIGMERFPASIEPVVDECLEMAREADVLVCILAWRYGWIPPGEERSITELEYDAADERLVFLLDPTLPVDPVRDYDEGPGRGAKLDLLDAFKRRVSSGERTAAVFQEETLALRVHQALERWRVRRSATTSRPPSPESPPDLEGELETYAECAAELYRKLPVAGFRTRLRVPIRLEELYVPLRVAADLRATGASVFADAVDAERRLGGGEESLEIPAKEVFHESESRGRQGLVLLGDPGSGKTTHLKRVLLWMLEKGPESLGLASGMLPVLVALRDHQGFEGDLGALIESQLDDSSLGMSEGFGRRLRQRGGLLLLLDGLDEVARPADRERVAKAIDAYAAAHPDCRFLVSCRFAGYIESVHLSERFLETHLRPLSVEQAEAFVRNWYGIVETGLARAAPAEQKAARAKAGTRADALIERLREPDFRARRVSELARNPLLLANLCLVHRDRGELPRRRAALYGECVEVLLERWRTGKGLGVAVTADDGRRVLQPAAYWLHGEEGRTRAPAAELAPVIEPALRAIRWREGTAAQFLRRIRDESGLLTGWDQERYGFMHLGFQEYLAAREIRRRAFQEPEVLRELAGHHGESWWQEVALLLVALEEPSLVEPYLREVVEQESFAKAPEALDALLEDAAEISPEPFLELAAREPGTDEALWSRQLVALRALERMGSPELDELRGRLSEHPSSAIRRWLGEQADAERLEIGVSERGEVELVPIPAGRFKMGSPESEKGRLDWEGPQHRVDVPAFEIGRYAVTNEEYGRFLAENPDAGEPKYWSDRKLNQARQPVVGVSWEEARRFASWAGCRLPTEAEWEYAARAGTEEPYLEGASEKALDRFAWYQKNSGGRVHPVGEKEPNDWGLHDVLGNVWQWVEDDWHGNYEEAPVDGSAWIDDPRGDRRVVRGGAFDDGPRLLRVAFRSYHPPGDRDYYLGFRVVRSRSGGQE